MNVDLHVHSIFSDGVMSPEQIIDAAYQIDIGAISITDHDNILAYDIAKIYAEKKAKELNKTVIDVIPGIEINTVWENTEVHVLGYYMDSSKKEFQDMLKYQQHARLDQTVKIVERLQKAGINIKFEDIKSLVAEGGSIGRPHIAKSIVTAGGTDSIIKAYNQYIVNEAPTYVQRKTVSPHEAVEIIYECDGIAVVAHPYSIENGEELIKDLINCGLRGIEAYHRKHSPAMVEYYSSMAEEYGLIITGGSDFHAPSPSGQMALGKNLVPAWTVEELKKEKNRLNLAEFN
ncbi:MAG: PHP domain-containing protein [Candidatus Gastranaerophilales bacterium]|nr:PHP domain-containing protein [Candidatus Gastranaerophilales bacterium]